MSRTTRGAGFVSPTVSGLAGGAKSSTSGTGPAPSGEYHGTYIPRETLGITGVKFPLAFLNGRVAASHGEQHIRESILQIIGANKGEVPMRPTFGSDLYLRVFDPIDIAQVARIDVEDAIDEWERRVDLAGVTGQETALGEVEINVEYVIRRSKRRGQTIVTIRS